MTTTSTSSRRGRTFLFSAVVAAAILLLACFFHFFYATFRSEHWGEVAGALGGFIGGVVGAGGAIWAVFLTLSRQRQQERANVASAVQTEVISLVKYIIAAIEVCAV